MHGSEALARFAFKTKITFVRQEFPWDSHVLEHN